MATTTQKISNSLWFDKEAEEAARFYTSLFSDSSIGEISRYGKEGFEFHHQPEGTVMTIAFRLANMHFIAINGGPTFKINPSISYYVVCESEKETDTLWGKLIEGGSALMALDKYPWSEKYGWLQDRYGLTWQISFGKLEDVGQKITPSLLFTGAGAGRAEEAMEFYTSIFEDSSITGILRYVAGEPDKVGYVKHAQFRLCGQTFMAMDSSAAHNFIFNEGVSFVVNCKTQEEIDRYWQRLTEGGQEVQCGWLKDKFGVSWQVVPEQLSKMLKDPDKKKSERVTKAFMQMKKFEIRELEEAFNG